MRFKTLKADQFMRLQDVDLPLDNQGLVLVLGKNLDAPNASSNGSGKSSLLDALCWCLWGKTIRGLKDDAVVNEDTGKNCRVSVEWEDGGHSYLVTRYRKMHDRKKPNDVELTVDGELLDGASMSETDRRIEDLLGLSFDTFQAMMPGAGIKAAELTDAKIKDLLEQLLQMDVISRAQEITKNTLKEVKADINIHENNIHRYEAGIAEQESLVQQYKDGLLSFEETKRRDVEAIDEELSSVRSDLERCEEQLAEAKRVQTQVANINQRLSSKTSQLSSIKQRLAEYTNTVRRFHEDLAANVAAAEASLRAHVATKKDFMNLGSQCAVCKQDVDTGHRAAVEAHLKEAEAAIRLQVMTNREALNGALSAHDNILAENIKEQSKVEADIKLLETQKASSLKEVNTESSILSQKTRLSSRLNALEQRKEDVSSRKSPFEGLIAQAVEKTSKLTHDWAIAKKSLMGLRTREEELMFWVTGFSTKGLRSLMLRHVTPILNARAKYYSDLLTAGEMSVEFSTERVLKSGKTKEEFTITVNQAHGSSTYKGSSAGERGRADLAIAFALGDLAHLRARKRVPFRFLDEPFEAIDDAGHESVVALLTEQRDTYDTVYCITHNQNFQQLFPKSFTVVKADGKSTLDKNHE